MINYNNIYLSTTFFEDVGFERIESPWWIPKGILDITSFDKSSFKVDNDENKCLVASGEQSLLYMYSEGRLPRGKYQTVTPCFRDDPSDWLHRKYFIKNELIITDKVNSRSLNELLQNSLSFFSSILYKNSLLKTVETNDGFDIEYNGVEIGSYGIRKTRHFSWIYGTGCAEPRLTIAKETT